MTKRTPTGDAGGTGRGKERLVDPEDSGHFDPALADPPTDQFGMVEDGHYVPVRDGDTLVTGNRDVLPAVPPDGVQAADPPATPGNSGETPESSGQVPHGLPAGSGGGSGRPSTLVVEEVDEERLLEAINKRRPPVPGRSIGRVLANTVIDAALGAPADLQDERAHTREAVEILVEMTADYHAHDQVMPAAKLMDLEGIVLHMVTARGLR